MDDFICYTIAPALGAIAIGGAIAGLVGLPVWGGAAIGFALFYIVRFAKWRSDDQPHP